MTGIQRELELLPADQQDRLSAFLTALRMKRDGLMGEIERRLDDDRPEQWISWKDAKPELRLDNPDSGG